MVFRQGEVSRLKIDDEAMFKARMRIAIQKHKGVLRRAANELDIGYSTLKRWIAADPAMQRLVKQSRELRTRVA